jgi:hypothetical protein
MRFSERYGHVPPRKALQRNNLDESTRNRLINAVIKQHLSNVTPYALTSSGEVFFSRLIDEFFKNSIDKATNRYDHAAAMLTNWAKTCDWFELFDLLEFIADSDDDEDQEYFVLDCNEIFEQEKVGYRFVSGKITAIVDELEIGSLEQTLGASDMFAGAKSHISRALELYSDRKCPDYRNCIKEAISAVESVCKVISGKKGATLSDAIKVIDGRHTIHPALKESLLKLYGYTSDKEGIRHALMSDPNVGHAEAKFMLVGCSAFCNYMIEQCAEK